MPGGPRDYIASHPTRPELVVEVALASLALDRGEKASLDLESGRDLLDLAKLLVDLERLLNRRVDVVTEKGLRPHVKEPILREAVAL